MITIISLCSILLQYGGDQHTERLSDSRQSDRYNFQLKPTDYVQDRDQNGMWVKPAQLIFQLVV